jgi:hypothetical protein
MKLMPIKTPVSLFIFNRPKQTMRVFEAIRDIKPSKLFIIADGPRPDKKDEKIECERARSIVKLIDWPCDVRTQFSKKNIGCKTRIVSGLNWLFSQVDECIILEDDCLPHKDFFRFAEAMLKQHRHNHDVGIISGNNLIADQTDIPDSYYFSNIPHMWGWATWKRVWQHYEVKPKNLNFDIESGAFKKMIPSYLDYPFWEERLIATYEGNMDTWDYQFAYMMWKHNFLSVVPRANLVTNIGFGPGATFTKFDDRQSNLPLTAMDDVIKHPAFVIVNHRLDQLEVRSYQPLTFLQKITKLIAYYRKLLRS